MNWEMIIISGITELLLIGLTILTAKALFEDSIVTDKKTISILLLDVAVTILSEWFGSKQMVPYTVICTVLIFTLWCCYFIRGNRERIWKRGRAVLYSFLLIIACGSSYSGTCVELLNIKGNNEDSLEYSIQFYSFVICVCIIFIIVIYRGLIRKGINLQCSLKERVFLLGTGLIVFSIYSIIISEMEAEKERGIELPITIRVIIVVLITIIYIAIPSLMISNKLSLYYEVGQRYQKEINELELVHFEQYKESQEETRRFRHDIINHLIAVQMLNENGKETEAKKYINDLLGRIQALSPKVVTGCEMLDCIVTSKLELMEQKNIEFSLYGVMDYGLDMKSIDICSIFSNAMDNAIEACEKIEGERNIVFSIKRTKSFYCVDISNTIDDSNNNATDREILVKKNGFTTKNNKELHGFGLGTIKKTVEENGGEISMEILDGRFCLTILLPVPQIDGKPCEQI